MGRIVEQLITELERSRDMQTALEILAATLRPLGFRSVDYGYVERPWESVDSPKPISLIHHNFPRNWDKLWKRFSTHDPIYLASLDSAIPIDLTEVRVTRGTTGPESEAWRCLDHLGLSVAIVVPTHLPQGRFSNVGIYWDPDRSMEEWKHTVSAYLDTLFVIGHYFCDTVDRKFILKSVTAKHSGLTNRELECLEWTARGKTNRETAAIIGRSKATVRFHLENAMRKLGAPNRAGAVACAYAMGWLRPH